MQSYFIDMEKSYFELLIDGSLVPIQIGILDNKMNNKKDVIQIFEELYNKYKNIYFSYIYKTTNNHDTAEDLLQEAFLKISNNLNSLKDMKKFKSWGFSIVSNICRDWYKKQKRSNIVYKENMDAFIDQKITINDKTSEKNITKMVDGILNTFEYEEREIFIFKHYEKKNYKEIGDILELSQRTVRRRMKSAIVKISSELKRLKFKKGEYFNKS